MPEWGALDRRKFPRVNYPCLVVINNGSKKDKEFILTHTENIGIGGDLCYPQARCENIFSC